MELLGVFFLVFLAAVLMNWILSLARFLWRLPAVEEKIRHLDNGIFVDQGMVFDKETGRPKSDKKPSSYAYRSL